MTHAEELIHRERDRQIHVERYQPGGDDIGNVDGEMLKAALLYIHYGTEQSVSVGDGGVPKGWPWVADMWKPKDRQRNLERAGAQCLAELSRCQRNGLPTGPAEQKLTLATTKLDELLASG